MSVQTQTSTAAHTGADQRAGKYLTFVLANEEYGFEILKVREIIGMMNTTAVPGMPRESDGCGRGPGV
jgi:purine-binding chemotaxis protein CheW